jgi:ankyrin repeat protein
MLLPIVVATLVLSGTVAAAPEDTSLVAAAKGGDLRAVQRALQAHRNPNETEADGTTALHWAIEENRADIVQALVAAGANVNAANNLSMTPLAVALTGGNSLMTELLLKAGANPRVPVPELGTPLLAAGRMGDTTVIKALLKAGVDVDEMEPASGQTALMLAASEGHEEAVKTLLAAGADVKKRSAREETALFFAVRKGSVGVVDALLAAGADVNERAGSNAANTRRNNGSKLEVPGDSMLTVAIVNAHFSLADFLLNNGADPNLAGANWTPLHALARVRNYEEMQYPPPMITPGDLDSLELAKHLIAHGANLNAQGGPQSVRRPGGDQNYKDLLGATPFFLAAKSGDVPYMKLLAGAGADVTIPEEDNTTPLMVAAGVGCVPGQWIEPEKDVLSAVKLLVEELKADATAQNKEKETPLHGAVCRGADSVIQYLADKGARFDIKDEDGQTPLDVAVDGLNRAVSINGPRIIIFHFPDHTVALVKKLAGNVR